MTTETKILTDEQIVGLYNLYSEAPGISFADVIRKAEQAVLQSPEVQALRKDAERYRHIKKGGQWIGAATQTGAQVGGEDLDALIDSEMEQS